MSRYDTSSFPYAEAPSRWSSEPPSARPTPQGHVLRGQYLAPLRSEKGKLKGVLLNSATGQLAIKFPKYLRPLLVRELTPGDWVQVWAFPENDRWRALNLMPWPEADVPADLKAALAQPVAPPSLTKAGGNGQKAPAKRPEVCIQVCSKGKCFKQGGQQIRKALQAEVEANPDLQHVTIEATGCMKACKQGPNLRVLPQKQMHSRMTPNRALSLLADYQAP